MPRKATKTKPLYVVYTPSKCGSWAQIIYVTRVAVTENVIPPDKPEFKVAKIENETSKRVVRSQYQLFKGNPIICRVPLCIMMEAQHA